MRSVLFALFCLGFFSTAALPGASAREKKPPFQVTVETSLQKDVPMVTLTVMNVSDSYQLFQSISCSWQDYWQTDDKNALLLRQQECAKNSPYTVILAPGEKHVEALSSVLFRGKMGKRTIRFGYARQISDFTGAELQRIYHSDEKHTYFSRVAIATRFKTEKETFWSAPIPFNVTRKALLR